MADAPPIQPESSPDLPPDMSNSSGANQDMLWSQVWQLPVLLFGLGLLVIGVYLSLPGSDPNDYKNTLADAGLLIESNKLEEANAALEIIKNRMNEVPATDSEKGYLYQLYGDLNFEMLYKFGVVGRQGVGAALPSYEKIVENYSKAKENGRELDGPSLRHYVISLVGLGKDRQALGILDQMTGPQAAQRYLIVRDMIERRRGDSAEVDLDALMPLIDRFREDIKSIADASTVRRQEVWVDGFQASLQMQAGDPQGAITYLLRRIQRLSARGGDDDLSPLIVKLAQAYYEIGDVQNAEQRFLHAQRRVDSTDDLNADILVGLGRLALAQVTGQDIEQALEYFRSAEEGYPSSAQAHISALMGRADCEARLGDHAAAHRYFKLAVLEMLDRTRPWDPRRQESSETIRTQFERAVDLDEYDRAKDYLDVLVLLAGDDLSSQLLLDLAATCERIADNRRDEARVSAERLPGQPPMTKDARRLANQQAADYYARAADYYYQHAGQVTIEDNTRHGQSLWSAAANYDKAQMWDEAIRVYEQFIQTRDGDPKRLRAIRNLARAYMADRQYTPALAHTVWE